MKSKKTFPFLQEQLLILKELQSKSTYHHLEVLDHELILNSNTLHTLPLEELQNTQTPRALEFYLEPKSSRQLQILWNHGKPPRSEVGWREKGLACKAQIIPKSLARAAGKHQHCRPKVPTRAPWAMLQWGGRHCGRMADHDSRVGSHGLCRAHSFGNMYNCTDQSK